MKSTLEYIHAVPEDAELLSKTAIDSKKTWGYSDDLMQLWKTDLEVTPDYILKNTVIKVFDGEQFVGFFALKTEEGNTELDHLWLTPENIRRNYGRAIFEYIFEDLSSNGTEKMTLLAEPNATGFYDKMGGEIIGKFESKLSGRFLDIYEFKMK
jgi:N-acetylglutamate synthase-like GNAT family acetyltransferase